MFICYHTNFVAQAYLVESGTLCVVWSRMQGGKMQIGTISGLKVKRVEETLNERQNKTVFQTMGFLGSIDLRDIIYRAPNGLR
jgi:hypothetical protein